MNDNLYALIKWPESQEYMNETWFDSETFLCNSDAIIKDIGYSAYFIPLHRIKQNQINEN